MRFVQTGGITVYLLGILILGTILILISTPKPLDQEWVEPSLADIDDITYKNLGTFKDCPVCPEMLIIPSNEMMVKKDNDVSELKTNVIKRFAIGKYEVTKEQYSAFIKESGYKSEKICNGKEFNWENPGFKQEATHPVVCINWNDAKSYVQWLSQKNNQIYRLPKESEWDYAAKAGAKYSRYWGESSDLACTYANVMDKSGKSAGSIRVPHNCDDHYVYTSPVGDFKPNSFGLYDIVGNAWEWVENCWDDNYQRAINKPLSNKETCIKRTLRGGCWNGSPDNALLTSRGGVDSVSRTSKWGLRVVRELD